MTVNVSTTASVCLYCKISSASDAEKEFHEIFDEVGIELQLPTLVEKFFHIKVQNKGHPERLCDDCVNRLVELFDLEEHAKEEGGRAEEETVVCSETETEVVEEDNLEKEQQEDNAKLKENENIIKNYENNPDKLLSHDVENQDEDFELNDHIKDHGQNQNSSDLDDIKSVDTKNIENQNNHENNFTVEDINIQLKHQFSDQNKDNIYIDLEDNENYVGNNNKTDKNVAQNLKDSKTVENLSQNLQHNDHSSDSLSQETLQEKNETLTSAASESEYNDDITFVEDRDDHSFNIENLINTNTNDDEFEIVNEADEISIEEDIQSSNDNENYTEENQETYTAFLDSNTIDSENFNSQDVINEEIEVEECEQNELKNDDLNLKESENEQEVVEDLNNLKDLNEICIDSDSKSINSNDIERGIITADEIDLDDIIVKDVNDTEDDTYSIEEEYLIEEIACSQEYDSVDLNEYLEKVLVTKFQDLELDWNVECKLCQDSYETFQDLLKHNCLKDLEEEQQYCCIIKDCEENFNDLNTFARHLIIQHYDKLESLTIYGKCADCQKSFSNFLEFNKHSCCRTIKRRTGSRNYCQYCDMDFQSLKRFVFHMQFHLTNHRPKICLLCGDLFNNSNDFFEHTQYKHSPEADMACIKCDRFFREKQVFDKHMELHEDAKYQYACIYCPKLYTNKYSLNKHMDIYHNNKSKALFCEYCEKEFVNNSSYRNHMKSHNTDVQVETFICCSCGFLTNSEECIRDHTETDRDSGCYAAPIEEQIIGFGYSCENCSIVFHTPKQLKQHRLSSIHNDDIYYCGICRRDFNNLRQMRNHMGNHKEGPKWEEIFPITRYFVCNIGDCQESYPIWTSLYYHKKRPHKTPEDKEKSKEFKCQFCQQNCTSKMSLAVHVARSHNNSNIICPHCKQSYRSQKLLQEHIDKFHTPIKCDICLKDFKHRRNLESHKQLVHLNIKRYFCSVCEKGYFYKSERDAHEKKVHPEFSYKCDICNFITNYPNSLEIHMDKHNNQQKFKCEICCKTFGRKQLLNVHLKRHQNKREYLCSNYAPECNCTASFYTYNQLKTHIQNKHPESKYISNNKRKKITKRTHIDLEDDDEDAYEMIYADDNDSIQVKRIKTTNESVPIDIYIEDNEDGDNAYDGDDVEYEDDRNEITLQQEMELDEEKSNDNDYEAICS